MKSKRFSIGAALAALAVPLLAQNAPHQSAASAPASLNAILEPIRAKYDLPALGGAILQGDRVIALGAVGVREVTDKTLVTPSDEWHIGSCTKAMTATLCAILVEQGKLKWDTTIADVFPELRETMRPEYRSVTLEQLLTNRAGLPAEIMATGLWAPLWTAQGSTTEQRRNLVPELLKLPPDAPPGTKFIYSNQNFVVAGAMAERVTGRGWEDLMREYIFVPLGMKSAGFGAPGTTDGVDQPRGHVFANDKLGPMQPGPRSDNPAGIGPAGIVHCSLSDWAAFVSQHVRGERGDGKLLLKPETFKKLHTPPPDEQYAFGWGVLQRDWGGTVISHAGSNTMWYCTVWAAPEKNFAVLVTTNCMKPDTAKAADEAAGALIQEHLKVGSAKLR